MFAKPLIAIDLGSSSVKLAVLDGRGRERKLRHLGFAPIQQDADLAENVAAKNALMGLFRELKLDPRGRRFAISLNGKDCHVRRTTMPDANPATLQNDLYFLAEQLFGEDHQKMHVTFTPLPNGLTPEEKKPYLLVGARREAVQQKVAFFKEFGMRPGIVDAEALTIANLFTYNYDPLPKLVAYLNLGASRSQLLLRYQEEVLLVQDLPFGGSSYTELIQKTLQLPWSDAEALKLAASSDRHELAGEIHGLIDDLNEQVAKSVMQTIEDFFNFENATNLQLHGLFLVGGGAKTIGLDVSLAAQLGLPVLIGNPFERLDLRKLSSQSLPYLAYGPMFAQVIGLALRYEKDDRL